MSSALPLTTSERLARLYYRIFTPNAYVFFFRSSSQMYWFPAFKRLAVQEPNKAQGFVLGTLTVTHGWPFFRRTVELPVFRLFSMFQPTFWQFEGSGQFTPGMHVERLETDHHMAKVGAKAFALRMADSPERV